MNKRQILGKRGEDLAAEYLQNKGYKILDRNWRFERTELDIIAEWEGRLIFIEVKTKKTDVILAPEVSVGPSKRRNIVDTANRYMEYVEYFHEIRFDIISIQIHSNASHTIKHLEDAFFPGME